jgi:hypothetical protein
MQHLLRLEPQVPPGRGLAMRVVGYFYPSHFERSLKPASPGLSLGVFGHFGTAACVTRIRLT